MAINTMLKHARGIICLAMDKERATNWALNFMTECLTRRENPLLPFPLKLGLGSHQGFLPMDRAHSIRVAADPDYGASDIVSPGHFFR